MNDKQPAGINWPRQRRPRPGRHWMIPLTTTLAVTAAIALPSILNSRSGAIALNPLGEHFVATVTPGEPDSPIAIVSTSTGSKTGYVNPLSHQVDFESAATGDGVHYVTSLDGNNACKSRLYKFTLNSAGTPSPMTSFGGLLHVRIRQLTMSADGQTIAYEAQRCADAPGSRTSLVVLNLASGQQRQWPAGGRQVSFDPMSLTADGTTLVFTADKLKPVASAIYLLDTSAAPGPLARRSRILVKPANLPHAVKINNSMITPEGRTVYFTASGGAADPPQQLWSANVSTRRVRLIARSLPTLSITPDPAVRRAIGVVEPATHKFRVAMVDLRTGKVTRLPQTFWISDSLSYIW
jgi:Tol biopolymer transport system component